VSQSSAKSARVARDGSALRESGAPERDRKANGVFYTPPRLAGLLAGWALEGGAKRILEPSYGDGVFLRQVERKLLEGGVGNPTARLHGVEIDPNGPGLLRELGPKMRANHLHEGDLLSMDVEDLGGEFDAILGNPPYIRHHLLGDQLVSRGRRSARALGVDLNGRSDAWAYFCAHLTTFLAANGRLALVLPGSVLHADYAKPLLEGIAGEGEVQLVRVGARLFPGVQERTVVLLVDRAKAGATTIRYRKVADLNGLGRALRREQRPAGRRHTTLRSDDPRLPWRLKSAEAKLWEEVCASPSIAGLGALAVIRIGVVTGANSFFIRSKKEAEELGKAVSSMPVVCRGAWLAGTRWSKAAQRKVAGEPSRLLLFPTSEGRLSNAAINELQRGEEEELHLRSHCVRRTPWYSISDSAAPDLFLPYMAAQPPRLVVNRAGATCTNSIHRVWLLPEAEADAETIASASWTTLFRLSAELVGRSYGGGVLKLEPSGAMQLRITLLAKYGLLGEIGDALASGGVEAARELADRRLLIEGLGMSKRDVRALGGAAARLSELRHS